MKELQQLLTEFVTFRGCPDRFPEKAIKKIPSLRFNEEDVKINAGIVGMLFYGPYAVLDCKIGDLQYFTYQSPQDKGMDDEILDIYWMIKNGGDDPLDNLTKSDFYKIESVEEKEEKIGVKFQSVDQLSWVLTKEMKKRGLYEKFLKKCEKSVLEKDTYLSEEGES